jgi:serine/threonine-protein kinase
VGEGFPQAAAPFAAGSRVGGYLLEEQIGQGGMAVVFRALDERLGRQVALKILAPALAADDAFRQRFIRESRAAAAVDDPHIIPVFEAGEAGGVLFIAMRYVRGGDVRSLLHREVVLGPMRVAAIISPVASALDAAHAAGLVHRDVKPANMLLDMRPGRPDHVYLSDFGLSKEALGATGLTGTGQFLGTVDYAAPEQVGGQQVGGQADQYALGCAAFEMLCGEPPFRRDQGMAVLYAHLSETPPPITSRRQGLPGALDPVFTRVLAKSPQDRYPSCAAFTRTLRQAAGLAPVRHRPASKPSGHRNRQCRRRSHRRRRGDRGGCDRSRCPRWRRSRPVTIGADRPATCLPAAGQCALHSGPLPAARSGPVRSRPAVSSLRAGGRHAASATLADRHRIRDRSGSGGRHRLQHRPGERSPLARSHEPALPRRDRPRWHARPDPAGDKPGLARH